MCATKETPSQLVLSSSTGGAPGSHFNHCECTERQLRQWPTSPTSHHITLTHTHTHTHTPPHTHQQHTHTNSRHTPRAQTHQQHTHTNSTHTPTVHTFDKCYIL